MFFIDESPQELILQNFLLKPSSLSVSLPGPWSSLDGDHTATGIIERKENIITQFLVVFLVPCKY